MKEKYKVEVELENKQIVTRYTYAVNKNTALCNVAYNLENKEGQHNYNFIGAEVIKEVMHEEIEEIVEKEIIKKIKSDDLGDYYVSNMGKAYSFKNDELVEMKLRRNGDRLGLTLRTKDGNTTTMNIDSLVWRTFKNDDSKRIRLEHIDKDIDNNKLSNLKKLREEKPISTTRLENELKKLDREQLLEIINRMVK